MIRDDFRLFFVFLLLNILYYNDNSKRNGYGDTK